MTTTRRHGLYPVACLMLAACAAAPAERTSARAVEQRDLSVAEFQTAYGQLDEEFGAEGKADLFGGHLSPCRVLAPLARGGNVSHVAFFVGADGEAVLGPGRGIQGYDVVFDLYHREMTVSKYREAGLGTPGFGASLELYAGIATGFREHVSDWDGWFVTTEAELEIPGLPHVFSVDPGFFVSAVDQNANGVIGPSEILLPPDGVYGASVEVTVGFDLIPSLSPVEGSILEGLWKPYSQGIRYMFDKLRRTRFFHFGRRLHVRLIDVEDGSECGDDWPEVGGDRDCVIQFGEPEWSNTHSALHMAYGICTVAGGCVVPLSWPMSATAVAVGSLRDFGGRIDEMCAGELPLDGAP